MKYFLFLILLVICNGANAISFREVSLNELVNESEYICKGTIIEITKVDSLDQSHLRSVLTSQDFSIGDPQCAWCTELATFVVSKRISGNLENDTLFIPFHRNVHFALPGLKNKQDYILFLQTIKGNRFHVQTDPRFGAKSSDLEKYTELINDYLILQSPEEKRKWLLDLCIDPNLSNQGMYNFKHSNRSHFSETEQQFLRSGLMKMNFDEDQYKRLLELVSKFGNNDYLRNKCFERLAKINEENVYEGLDLMCAIRAMDNRLIYNNMINEFIDGFGPKSTNTERLEIITYFLKEKK